MVAPQAAPGGAALVVEQQPASEARLAAESKSRRAGVRQGGRHGGAAPARQRQARLVCGPPPGSDAARLPGLAGAAPPG
ncbi:unnamed protein product [Prorocentrum cordatum]|uniref:Uncharacterized protein n=1 Tax=Prorocentrum cordatum TaxID=2364126 RepID=A0ABN9X9J3_9DINO|nr:unnamed protein product [Polarella glacialis]